MIDQISVVISTFNSSDFIVKTLESVLTQSLKPKEIIVVDDASTDNTGELVSAIAQQSPVPIVLQRLTTNSGGPARPLNVGVSLASGSLIATLDHDDLMLADKLRIQSEYFSQNDKLGLVISNYSFDRGNQRKEGSPLKYFTELVQSGSGSSFYRIPALRFYEALIADSIAISCSNFLFPKAIWQECGGFDEELNSCCDYGFLQSVATKHDIGVIDKTLFYYNLRDDSLFRTVNRLERRYQRLYVFRRFDRRLLSVSGKKYLKQRLAQELLGIAHLLRDQGEFGRSLTAYVECLKLTGWNAAALAGILKLVPYKFLNVTDPSERKLPTADVLNERCKFPG